MLTSIDITGIINIKWFSGKDRGNILNLQKKKGKTETNIKGKMWRLLLYRRQQVHINNKQVLKWQSWKQSSLCSIRTRTVDTSALPFSVNTSDRFTGRFHFEDDGFSKCYPDFRKPGHASGVVLVRPIEGSESGWHLVNNYFWLGLTVLIWWCPSPSI